MLRDIGFDKFAEHPDIGEIPAIDEQLFVNVVLPVELVNIVFPGLQVVLINSIFLSC